MRLPVRLPICAGLVAAALTACGGGGGGGTSASGAPPVVATATPTPGPSLAPSASASITAGAAAGSATLGPIQSGLAATVGVPATTAGSGTLTVTLAASASTAPALASMARAPRSIGASGITGLAYVSVTPTATLSFAGTPSFTFTVTGQPTLIAPAAGYVAFYDPAASGGWTTLLGPVTIGGSSATWTFPAGAVPLTFKAGSTYVFALFTATSAVATPSPSPSPSPAASASPVPSPTASSTPGSAPQSAPAIGLLGAVAGGGFGGVESSSASGATLVGMAPGLQGSSGNAVTAAGSVSVAVNGAGGSAVRRAPSSAAMASPAAAVPVEFQPLGSRRALRAAQRSLRLVAAGTRSAATVRRTRSLPTTLGATALLWAQNAAIGSNNGTYTQVPATLAAITAHAYVWIDSSLTSVLTSPSTFNAIANDFENGWASDNAHFTNDAYDAAQEAPQNACDANGNVVGTTLPIVAHDVRTTVFVVNPASLGGGVGGYFDEINFYAQSYLQCFESIRSASLQSNEAPMIYVGWFGPGGGSNTTSYELGEDLVRGTAHEYQHLLNFVAHDVRGGAGDDEDSFINEGLSMLAQDLAVPRMYPQLANDALDAGYHANRFLAAPQNFSLTGFSGVDNAAASTAPAYNCSGCYGASYLFQRYAYDRFGGDAYLASMENGSALGLAHMASVVNETPAALLEDFGLTLASANGTSDARYRIPGFAFGTSATTQFATTAVLRSPATVNGAPGAGTFAGPFDGGYVLVAVPGAGATVTVKETTGAFSFAAGIAQH